MAGVLARGPVRSGLPAADGETELKQAGVLFEQPAQQQCGWKWVSRGSLLQHIGRMHDLDYEPTATMSWTV